MNDFINDKGEIKAIGNHEYQQFLLPFAGFFSYFYKFIE